MSAPASRLARRSEDLAGELLAPAARGLAAKLIGESAHLPRRFLADLATHASQGTLAILSGHESSSLVLVVVLVGDRGCGPRSPALSMSMKATTFRDRCRGVGYSA